MVVIARGWLLLAGVEAGWVRGRGNGSGGAEMGPGARKWVRGRVPTPPLNAVSQRTFVWDFDPDFGVGKKVRILTIPLCWGPPGCLPRHFLKIRHF